MNGMKNEIAELTEYKSTNNIKEFGKVLSKFIPSLRKYIRTKLKVAEAKKKIPKGMYTPDDILDEIYLKVFNEFGDTDKDAGALKLKLFTLTNELLKEKLKTEDWRTRKIDIDELLKNELKTLEEEFTVDADGDFVMMDELEDISYKQEEFEPNLIILEKSQEEDLIKSLELEGKEIPDDMEKRKALGQLYSELSELSQAVLDLYAFGNLTIEEIAEVQNMKVEDVEKLITKIKIRFQTNIA